MGTKSPEVKKDAGLRTRSCILGIDPGLAGGIVVVERDRLLAAHDMPSQTRIVSRSRRRMYDTQATSALIRQLQAEYSLVCAAVERVGASPQMGVTSAFSFGHGYGILHGILAALGIKAIAIEPTVWKRRAGVSGSDKSKSIQRAHEIFNGAFPLKEGTAEAALIAHYVLNEVDVWS